VSHRNLIPFIVLLGIGASNVQASDAYAAVKAYAVCLDTGITKAVQSGQSKQTVATTAINGCSDTRATIYAALPRTDADRIVAQIDAAASSEAAKR
jgi:hypothetical protein